jgi:signal transduction histidine kinase
VSNLMFKPKWLEPSRHLLILFLATALLLVGALLWLGWQLARQDRELADKRLQERQETAADLCVAALQQAVAQAETRLADISRLAPGELEKEAAGYARTLSEDSVLVLERDGKILIYPARRLPFYPDQPAPLPFPDSVFAEADALEFRSSDYPAALSILKPLARASDKSVRAEALLRIARIHGRQKEWDAALEAYTGLSSLVDTPVTGLPADLVAGQARMRILASSGRPDAARQEAAALLDGLKRRRWRIARGQYEFYAGEALRVLGRVGESPEDPESIALAGIVASLWENLHAGDFRAGRRLTTEDADGFLVLQQDQSSNRVSLVLGPKWLNAQFVGALDSSLDALGVAIRLSDPGGRIIRGAPVNGEAREAIRLASATGLPWNLQAASINSEEVGASAWKRQQMLITGMAAITMLFVAGVWLIGRAVTRELALSRLQSDFVSSVSHEFRTPLSSICLMSELLEAGRVAGDADRSEYYRVLARDSRRLRRMVDSLLNFGRMEAGAMEFRFDTIDPADLVHDVTREFQYRFEEGSPGIEVHIGEGAPLVRADRSAMDCVVWNLLDNAVKYSPEGSSVRVDVERENGRAAIRVRDYGCGIPAAEQKRIFEKFVRGKGSEQSGIPGTGIGLALARHIVTAHGGEIRLVSSPAEGSTFTVLLPAVDSPVAGSAGNVDSGFQKEDRNEDPDRGR